MKLLLESDEFVAALAADVATAEESLYAQTLSFEDDVGGRCLADLYLTKPGLDRRLVIDSYTRHIINDRYLYSPTSLLDGDLQREARGTRKLVAKLRADGAVVHWVNPMGLGLRRISARNHKKIIAVDRASAYIGGINFSAHNFAWHDLMLRFDEPAVVEFLRDDFLRTCRGENQGGVRDFDGVRFAMLDGARSEEFSKPVMELIRSARERVFIESPYLSAPYYDVLGEVARRGVEVTVLAPAANNWGYYDAYTRWEVETHGLRLRYYPGRLSHLKAIAVDDRAIVVGSSNFDFFSYHLHQELMAIVTDAALVADFNRRVRDADLAVSLAADLNYDRKKAKRAKAVMNRLFEGMHWLNKGRFSQDSLGKF